MRGVFARIMAVLSVALVATLCVLGSAVPAHAAEEGTIHSLANQSRASAGLAPLTLNGSLTAVALAWAQQMAANGTLSHNPSYSAQIPGGWQAAAENVAQGYGSGAAVHAGWMSSPGHRANILGDFTDVGIAHIAAGGTTWSVQVFAKYPTAPVAAAPPPAPIPAPAPAPAPDPAPAAEPTPGSVPEPGTDSEDGSSAAALQRASAATGESLGAPPAVFERVGDDVRGADAVGAPAASGIPVLALAGGVGALLAALVALRLVGARQRRTAASRPPNRGESNITNR